MQDVRDESDGSLPPAIDGVACRICLGGLTNVSEVDPCHHRFCFSCLLEWSKRRNSCPLCNTRFSRFRFAIKSQTDFKVHPVADAHIEDPSVFRIVPRVNIGNFVVERMPGLLTSAQSQRALQNMSVERVVTSFQDNTEHSSDANENAGSSRDDSPVLMTVTTRPPTPMPRGLQGQRGLMTRSSPLRMASSSLTGTSQPSRRSIRIAAMNAARVAAQTPRAVESPSGAGGSAQGAPQATIQSPAMDSLEVTAQMRLRPRRQSNADVNQPSTSSKR